MTVAAHLTFDSANKLDLVVSGEASLATIRDVLTVEGADAQKFLHSLVSQCVDSLVVGEQRWSFLLQPQGKVLGMFTITRSGDQSFVISTELGQGSTVTTQLQRYKIRTKAELVLSESVAQSCRVQDGVVVFGETSSDDLADEDGSLFVGLRVTLGLPSFGAELDDQTVPNETGFISLAVNFKKGCYVGQELVERIDSRGGNVPKHVSWIRLPSSDRSKNDSLEAVTDSPSDDAEPLRTIEFTTKISGLIDSDLIGLAYADRKTLSHGRATALIDGELHVVSVNPVSHS